MLGVEVAPEKEQISEQIERLVARQLVGKAQLVLDRSVGPHHERVLVRGAQTEVHLAQRLGLRLEAERARAGDLRLEGLRRHADHP